MAVPLWAYAVAFGGAFLAARAIGGGDELVAEPPATAGPTLGADASAGGDYGGYGGGGEYGLIDGGLGAIPYPVDPGDDFFDPPPTSVVVLPPPVTPTPSPPPSSTPAPTGTLVNRPAGPAPAGAAGWTVLGVGHNVFDPRGGNGSWDGRYPVQLSSNRPLTAAGARWVAGAHDGVKPNGERIRVRRISKVNSRDWVQTWIRDGTAPVISSSTSSVRI